MNKLDFSKLKKKYAELSDNQKKFLFACFSLVLVCIAVIVILAATKNISSVNLECYGSEKMSKLQALDTNAQSGIIKKSDYASFKFSREQKSLFKKIYDDNSTVALTVRIQLKPTKNQLADETKLSQALFRFGFLDSSDFSARGKFIKQIFPDNHRIVVSGKEENAPAVFDVSFAIQKNDDIAKVIPEGFFIYSSLRCKVLAACVVPAELGFDLTNDVPFYGFACNGGLIDFSNVSYDFSGASMVFPVQNSSTLSMPEYVFTLSENEELKSTYERAVKAEVNLGGEKIYIKNAK